MPSQREKKNGGFVISQLELATYRIEKNALNRLTARLEKHRTALKLKLLEGAIIEPGIYYPKLVEGSFSVVEAENAS